MTSSSIPTASNEDARSADPVERLLEDHWSERDDAVGRRELLTEVVAALVFLAIAVPLAAGPFSSGDVDGGTATFLVLLYAAVSRIEFPLGIGFVVPSYLVLVPMLLLLPPEVVPLLVATALVLGALGQVLSRHAPPKRVLFSVADATHALGPAVVLAIWGTHNPSDEQMVIYIGAFLAACAADTLSSILRELGSHGVHASLQLRVLAMVWLVDACLAPIGLLVALQARAHGVWTVLVIIPFCLLLWLFARDRSARIDQSHRRLDQAVTDPLTQLGNRRKLATDLEGRLQTTSAHVLMLFDLDGFKIFNDTFGHLAGDGLLQRLGTRLADTTASHGGTAYRLGGDEFCVLLEARPERLDEAIVSVAGALTERGETFSIDVTYGAVLLPAEADRLETALQLADERMYARKHRGSAAAEQAAAVLLQMLLAARPALHRHAIAVAERADAVGRELSMSIDERDELRRAAELHDIGCVAQHPDVDRPLVLAERVLRAAPALAGVAAIVRAGHEHFDGTGGPDGLEGESIPLPARILAVCDAYEEMTGRGIAPDHALAELRASAGTRYDPAAVEGLAAAGTRAADEFRADIRQRTARETAAQLRHLLNPSR